MASGTRAPSTIVTVSLNGQTDFNIPFEYLARKFVVVTLLGIDRKVLTLNSDYRFVSKTVITLANPTPAGYTQLELRRVTSATERLVDFHDGSILRAYDLNLSQIQTLHVAEEARDLAADILGVNDDGNLDARGKRITNVGYALDGGDAVPLGQLVGMENGAYQSAVRAEYFAGVAQDAAGGIGEGLFVTARGSSEARQLPDRFADYVNVKDFGAKGDGISDDSAAFTAASAKGVDIFVPAGTYNIGSNAPTVKCFGTGTILQGGARLTLSGLGQRLDNYAVTVGPNAGSRIAGIANVAIGYNAGGNITTGTKNVFVGHNGGSGNAANPARPELTGSDNIGIGFHALKRMETGVMNVGVGTDAGNSITTGSGNTLVGGSAGQQVSIGGNNTMIGRSAGLRLGIDANASGTPSDGSTWVNIAGSGNTVAGRDAMRNGYNCDFNTVFGYNAMRGTQNDVATLTGNITGGSNVVIGYNAMYTKPTTAAGNVVIGTMAGRDLSTGATNVIIGHNAARDTEGSGNIILGPFAYRSVTSASNKLVVSNTTGTPFIGGDMGGAGAVSNTIRFDAMIRPNSDNDRSCGTAAGRWSLIFAGSGTINTSDAREKTAPVVITDSVLDAWGDVQVIVFQWLEAIRRKGADDARWHFGVMAQQVRDAFVSHGLDGRQYGLLCYDEWEARDAVLGSDGEVVESAVEAGNRWGIRPDQCLWLEAAYQRRRCERIEERLAKLELQ